MIKHIGNSTWYRYIQNENVTGPISTDAARCYELPIFCLTVTFCDSLHIQQKNPFIQNVSMFVQCTILKNCLLLLLFSQKLVVHPDWKYYQIYYLKKNATLHHLVMISLT